ncbi:malate synthase-like [Microplitis demolitor]|uniref:malate synthase-like n=1 Tax=Microplitis demolitor TaxID=69319 RepID=UPI00235B5F0C|nr:malate synthase-like [Microplitis demolitor]
MDAPFLSLISQAENTVDNLFLKGKSNTKSNSKIKDFYINTWPKGLEQEFNELLTCDAIEFLVDLVGKFENYIEDLYNRRLQRKLQQRNNPQETLKFFKLDTNDWKVAPVNGRLSNRRLDLGDVSPSNLEHFTAALKCTDIQGIQVDFDDGHCPTWFNQIYGLHNVYKATHNLLPGISDISQTPILMLRPRAWNMIENNCSINGKCIPGPLFDYGLLIFHNGRKLQQSNSGPCFYLSKLENYQEAKLWNDIFSWSEIKLGLPYGSIKACVLIENINACFEMERILYELKDHSLGLNCGIWDYAASIISKFANDKFFVLPDRNKYVNMNQRFLKKYLQLVIKICHKRGIHATGGMVAKLLPKIETEDYKHFINNVLESKLTEIQEGIDGFLIYDMSLIPLIKNLWKKCNKLNIKNQINYPGSLKEITEQDLLTFPKGGVTIEGLKHNICVSILFIYNWLNGKGHFILRGSVEDSATAEISRSQIWQWIRHAEKLENYDNIFVTKKMIKYFAKEILDDLLMKSETNYGNCNHTYN